MKWAKLPRGVTLADVRQKVRERKRKKEFIHRLKNGKTEPTRITSSTGPK
jgi:hypothetical protein